MKRILPSILFLLVLSAPFVATTWFFKTQQHKIRKQVKRSLVHSVEKSELVELKFANSELQTKLEWKHSKEFRFEGEMYDIVHKTEHADSTTFYCWWDHEETKLYKKLDQLLAAALGTNPTRQQQSKLALQFFKTLYFNDLSNNTWILNSTVIKYSLLNTNPVKVYSLPTTPPPQTV